MSPASNRTGFTLIELIISVAIIGIITTVVFTNFIKQNQSQAVRSAANRLATDIQKMYIYAQAGRPITTGLPAGYGLHFQPNQTTYTLFQDTNGGLIAGTTKYQGDGYYTNSAEDITTQTLRDQTTIDTITAGGVGKTTIDLLYGIPGATLQAHSNTGSESGAIIIKIKHIRTESTTSCVQVTPQIGSVNVITCP